MADEPEELDELDEPEDGEQPASWREPPLVRLLLTDEEVGWQLGVPASTVRNLHRVGQLAGVVIGRHLRWRQADVAAFVEGLRPGNGGQVRQTALADTEPD